LFYQTRFLFLFLFLFLFFNGKTATMAITFEVVFAVHVDLAILAGSNHGPQQGLLVEICLTKNIVN